MRQGPCFPPAMGHRGTRGSSTDRAGASQHFSHGFPRVDRRVHQQQYLLICLWNQSLGAQASRRYFRPEHIIIMRPRQKMSENNQPASHRGRQATETKIHSAAGLISPGQQVASHHCRDHDQEAMIVFWFHLRPTPLGCTSVLLCCRPKTRHAHIPTCPWMSLRYAVPPTSGRVIS